MPRTHACVRSLYVCVCMCLCVSLCVCVLRVRFGNSREGFTTHWKFNLLKLKTRLGGCIGWTSALIAATIRTHRHTHIQPHWLPLPNIDTRQCCQLREKHVQWRLNNLFMLSYARQRERCCHCRCLCHRVQGIPCNGQLVGHYKLIKNIA